MTRICNLPTLRRANRSNLLWSRVLFTSNIVTLSSTV